MWTREECGYCAEFFGGSEAADRDGLGGAFHRFFDGNLLTFGGGAAQSYRAVGRNHAGEQSVDRDSVASGFERERLGPSDDRAAKRVRYADTRNRLNNAERRDVEDSAPFE